MKNVFDIIVIGAGAGGLVVAIGGAKAGKKVLLIEKGEYGGDCTNYGCIPSKSLIASAHNAHALTTCSELGIDTSPFSIDANGVLDRVRSIISKVRSHEEADVLNKFGVETLEGAAFFQDRHTLTVGEKKVRGKQIVIATGSYPVIPNIPGLEGTPFLTNETVFSLKEIPKSMIFVGGGPISCELAQAFARLGSAVTLIVRKPYIMNREDRDAREVVMDTFRKEGINLLLECQTERISFGKTFDVEVRGKSLLTLSGEQLFIGAGRRPQILNLNLDAAKVSHTEEGIMTDAYGRTSTKNIWAVGDAIGPPFFTHYAENQGRAVLLNLLLPFKLKKSKQPLPRVTFTDPEVASIGVMEEECDKSKVAIYTVPFSEVDRNITSGRTEGFVKIITKKWSSHILGATIVGPRAGEMLMQISVAMMAKIPLRKLSSLIYPYPIENLAIRKAADKWFSETILPRFRK